MAHGLLGMRERIAMLGGTFVLRRGDNGVGTVVDAFVPFAARSDAA
jgi:signal transduction histidine kinase